MAQPPLPLDPFNLERMQYVFPSDWKNPEPAEIYDLIVIGNGPGGGRAAYKAVGLNAKVAIIEREHMGGECFNVGCIPSKALLRSSRCAAQVRDAAEFGIEVPDGWKVNFPAIMQRVRKLQSLIAPYDSAESYKKLGIDVFLGHGRFINENTLEVNGKFLRFKKAIIATGTQPIIPEVIGLEEAGYLTNQTVFNLDLLPPRLAVLGAGPIACELSQAFLRFGSEVTLVTHGARLLPRDDEVAAERLYQVFQKEGMKIVLKTQLRQVEKKGHEKILHLDNGQKLIVDDLLIAIGRAPNVDGLGLEKAHVAYDLKKGVIANDHLQTSNPAVYVAGDVAFPYKFTHVAVKLGEIAVHNALNSGSEKASSLLVPWATYTEPEVAHIGLQESDAKEKGIAINTSQIDLKDNDRAILEGDTAGFVKIHTQAGTNRILGATVMANHAGDMIAELAVVMDGQNGVGAVAHAIHPFPTQAEAICRAAGALGKD